MEDSVFTKIIKRELPAEILYEDDTVIAILNRFPNTAGETLVITKQQVPYLFDLDDATYAHLMKVVKKMAKALDAAFLTLRTCVVVEGLEVPHVHVRLYPITVGSLSIQAGPEASEEALRLAGDKIRKELI